MRPCQAAYEPIGPPKGTQRFRVPSISGVSPNWLELSGESIFLPSFSGEALVIRLLDTEILLPNARNPISSNPDPTDLEASLSIVFEGAGDRRFFPRIDRLANHTSAGPINFGEAHSGLAVTFEYLPDFVPCHRPVSYEPFDELI